PKPHRIFLSPSVNAAVFHDQLPWNLFVPPRKNLDIGLGLVNSLDLSEFKAVVAHEFGHFAQRSMSVGAWVYTAQHVTAELVHRRDAMDRLLDGISRSDVRIAWVGWAMRVVVWAIRSIVDTLARLVLALARGLNREMEFQADRVAASVAGSDAIVHALWRLQPADEAWEAALALCASNGPGTPVADVFAAHAAILAGKRGVLGDPLHGLAPALPARDRAAHRVFRPGLEVSARMYSTHPPTHEREENVKREYVPSELDARSPWLLFDAPERLRREVTRELCEQLSPAPQGEPGTVAEPVPIERTLAEIAASFEHPSYAARYRGAWLERRSTLRWTGAEALPRAERGAPAALQRAIAALYPVELGARVDDLRRLERELAGLRSAREELARAPGGRIVYHGRTLRRRDLPALEARVQRALDAARRDVEAHDERVRALHLGAAEQLGGAWAERLRGLARLVRYAEHGLSELEDANGALLHTWSVVTADGTVDARELERVSAAGAELARVIGTLHIERGGLALPPELLARLDAPSWSAYVEARAALPGAVSPQAIVDGWLGAAQASVASFVRVLSTLRLAALDELVTCEDAVAAHLAERVAGAPAPELAPQLAPELAPTSAQGTARVAARIEAQALVHAGPRARTEKLSLWNRFQIADGFWAGTARLAAAALLIVPPFLLTRAASERTIHVHNGLGCAVDVALDGVAHRLAPRATLALALLGDSVHVRTTGAGGAVIDEFERELESDARAFAYNVGGASVLYVTTANYGAYAPQPDEPHGRDVWLAPDVADWFQAPPAAVSTSGTGAYRRALETLDKETPGAQLSSLRSNEDAQRLGELHARFDDLDTARAWDWWYAWHEAGADPRRVVEVVRERRARGVRSVALDRFELDALAGAERAALCAEYDARSAAAPQDADLCYLSLRNREGAPAAEFAAAHARFPEHPWIAGVHGAELARQGRWAEAAATLGAAWNDREYWRSAPRFGALELARVRRMAAEEPTRAQVRDLEQHVEWLATAQSWDRSAGPRAGTPLERAYDELEPRPRGPRRAWKRPDLVALRAASDGATAEELSAGLQLDARHAYRPTTLWVLAALFAREKQDLAPLRALAAEAGALAADIPFDWLEARAQAAPPPELEHEIAELDRRAAGLTMLERGALRALGVVLLRDGAPAAWRTEANALLFAFERPTFDASD
ncbi:MAG: hypothetical protein EPO68_17485, partial [Planctomycetota bacterium]